jgi:hypothetical protein
MSEPVHTSGLGYHDHVADNLSINMSKYHIHRGMHSRMQAWSLLKRSLAASSWHPPSYYASVAAAAQASGAVTQQAVSNHPACVIIWSSCMESSVWGMHILPHSRPTVFVCRSAWAAVPSDGGRTLAMAMDVDWPITCSQCVQEVPQNPTPLAAALPPQAAIP